MKIYIAAPLFTSAERAWNKQLEQLLLQSGHQVFLPQDNKLPQRTARTIFEADRALLDAAEVVVAIMDGPDPDSGTSWECGYAYGKKPIVLVRTDFRSSGDRQIGPFNAMLLASADLHYHLPLATAQQVVETLNSALAQLASHQK
jgi:nucleoside 2-deoxyribosyltransferase